MLSLDVARAATGARISWRELGFEAQGRSQALRLNYRNIKALLAAAYRLISELDSRAAGRPELAEDAMAAPEDETHAFSLSG